MSFQNRTFGISAEHYLEQLLELERIKTGNNLPDFIRRDTEIPFLLEVKSGLNKKGIINDYQLSYTAFALQKIARWNQEEIFSFIEQNYDGGGLFANKAKHSVAVYYTYIERIDKLRLVELDKNNNRLRIQFGDRFIVPYEYVFYQFVNQYIVLEQK